MYRTNSAIVLFILLAKFQTISSTTQFCSTLHTTTKQAKCPDPSSFDILKEYAKPLSTWKLDFSTLANKTDVNIIQEIKNRFQQVNSSCPYVRQTNKTACCDGWQGPACDQPAVSAVQQSFATCHLWGTNHIRTFDGTYYQFPGSCIYKLVGAATWQINIQPINCTNLKDSCRKKLTIVIGGQVLEVIGTEMSNSTTLTSGLTIRRQHNKLDLYYSIGVRLKIDHNQQTIVIQVDQNVMMDKISSGLCGDYNGNQDDDLKLLTTGLITSTPVDFGNQWKLDSSCPDVSPVVNSCSIVSSATVAAAADACVLLSNQSNVFNSCFEKVDPSHFYEACLTDVCSASLADKSLPTARCRALEAYADECNEHAIHIQWRSTTGCGKRCTTPNMVFAECASSCPRTCQNPSSTTAQCHMQNGECSSGCVCSNETVLDVTRNKCVRLEQCSCQYNNIQYQPGDQVSIDCNDCKCDHGRWLCTNRTCLRTCLVLGDSNILTFDGKHYALVSKCNHVLVETNDQSNYLRVTYTSNGNELSVKILNSKVILRQDGTLINGAIRHTLPYQNEDLIIRQASTILTEIRDLRSSVVIQFDALTSRVYVKLQPSFVNRVRGLCGTFNYITSDDFLTPNKVIETNLATFANAYVVPLLTATCSVSDQQTDTCFRFPANEQTARIECTNLLRDPLFSSCSPVMVDPNFFITSCIRDLCADLSSSHRDKVKCATITALAHACALKGVQIDWFNNPSLAGTCQTINYGQCNSAGGSSYSECVSECQSTCSDIDIMSRSCVDSCLPGCKCPSGHLYDEHSRVCQIRAECPCYEVQSEQYIHPSHSLLLTSPLSSNCSCANGSLECTSLAHTRCGSTQIYSSNTTVCPRTCANYLSHFDCGLFAPGCTCLPGKILLGSNSNQQQCVSIDECPCVFDRRLYLQGETMLQFGHGCQNCTCQQGGSWSCTSIICTKTCTVFGESHYQTFDGLNYDHDGSCQYILAKEENNLFSIVSQNVPCGANGQACSKNIIIDYKGSIIDLIRGRNILLNNVQLSNYEQQPVTFGSIAIFKSGIFTVIKTDDFTVKWDGMTRIDIIIKSSSKMRGLCGNNNDNLDDDTISASGALPTSIADMAHSWQTSANCASKTNQSTSAQGNDPCGDDVHHEQRRTWAQSKCNLIKMKTALFNNPFQLCIEKMEANLIETFYRACLYDACHADYGGDCEAVCTVLGAFAAKCQSIVKSTAIEWRTADRCPMQCDAGKVYMACGPLCPQTCFNSEDYGGCTADSGCVDGCFCPNGQVMNSHGQCVEPHRCPCSYENKIYPQGSRIFVNNDTCRQECECQNGSFLCSMNDTKSCITTNCTSNQLTCQSDGQCIPLNWKCDQIFDCQDGSDERTCIQQCDNQTNMFQCANGQCIDGLYRCDGLLDCRDGSDEVNCSYVIPCKEFECPTSKLCIPKAWICDGTVDCGHGDDADESGDCKLNQCDTLSGRYFQCRHNGDCLPIEQRCDAHKDCDDGSDESDCSLCSCQSSFTCTSICQCIDSRRVCDGISDCIDSTDEFNCTSNCATEEYTCLDGKCLNRTMICDGIRHCSKGEDETHPDCAISKIPTITTKGTKSIVIPHKTTIPTRTFTTAPTIKAKPGCENQLGRMLSRFISEPQFSTPIIGSVADLYPGGKGIRFVVITSSTPIIIVLPFTRQTIVTRLIKLEIPKPSNVDRFRVTLIDREDQWIDSIQLLSTGKKGSSPIVDKFPTDKTILKKIRGLKIEIFSTDNGKAPDRVTILLEACFETKELPIKKNCTEVDAMDASRTARIIAKLGGSHPVNSTYGQLLLGYGGVTYETSQAVIDVRFHNDIISQLSQISIPDYAINRTNVRKIVVEVFDRYHRRLFAETTTTMSVEVKSDKQSRSLPVRFIRVSILETSDDYAPYNVTLSIRGCFNRVTPMKTTTTQRPSTTTIAAKRPCFRANAMAPQFAHKIIGQFEGTQPLPGSSFVDFIEPHGKGVTYGKKSPVIIIRFQANVVGELDQITIAHHKSNVKQFQVDLFDYNNNLLFSNQTISSENDAIIIPSTTIDDRLFVSFVQITILDTTDDRSARGIIISILGCFSTFPKIETTKTTTTTPKTAMTTARTTHRPRDCHWVELLNSSTAIRGITSKSKVIHGYLGDIGRKNSSGVTFSHHHPSIDFVLRSNLLLRLNRITILSTATSNIQRFRIELLDNENYAQYKIESSSISIDLEHLPAVVLAGIRITLLETEDHQPPRNVILSIQACFEEIFIPKSSTTTPAMSTTRTYAPTIGITPDHCAEIDAMQEPYSEQTLAGITGTNPVGITSSLLDLVHGKSISFNGSEHEIVLFLVFKSNLFVYLKSVGLSSMTTSNVKRMKIDYLDKNQLLIRTTSVDYPDQSTQVAPIQGVGSLKITIVETRDGQPVRDVALSVKGCFGIEPPTTVVTRPQVSITTPTPCQHVNLMSNKPVAEKVIAFVSGTQPSSGSILDYFNKTLPTISYTTINPIFIIVFKSNIYVELKSISLISVNTNVIQYQIDLIDDDKMIVQTIVIDQQKQQQSDIIFEVAIAAVRFTYLKTSDGQPPRNILLIIDGCFGTNLSPPTKPTTTTRPPLPSTTSPCHEIDMMNKVDSTILVDSVSGTLPANDTNQLKNYFNPTSLISYQSQEQQISFLIIFKSTIYAEIQSISLNLSTLTNINRFQVDLIDDYKTIVQKIQSNENLTVDGLTQVGIAAVQITYLNTTDGKPPRNIRLSIRGCFGILPSSRRTTAAVRSTTTTTTKPPRTISTTTKRPCQMLDAMSIEHRNKLIRVISNNESSTIFSSDGLSFNSTNGSIEITFKTGIISDIDRVSIVGDQHNVEQYRVTFFDFNGRILDERLLNNSKDEQMPIEGVASVRVTFLETTNKKNIVGVKLSIRGCFFKIPHFTSTRPTLLTGTTKLSEYCQSIDLMTKSQAKRVLDRIGGTLSLSQISSATPPEFITENDTPPFFFILHFKSDIFIRQIENISISTAHHNVRQIRLELFDSKERLLTSIDLPMLPMATAVYLPSYPMRVKLLKVTILKGNPPKNLQWSIIGCFDKIKPIKTYSLTKKYHRKKISCIHSNIMAGRNHYHPQKSLTPFISGMPMPIDDSFSDLMSDSPGISYSDGEHPAVIEIDFPPGIVGRLYEVGIRSSNVHRIRVQLIEVPNGVVYTLTTPRHQYDHEETNPRLTGFPPVIVSGIRITLLATTDGRGARRVTVFTNGCFYTTPNKYTAAPTLPTTKMTTMKTGTTSKPSCNYTPWTNWGHCPATCGNGIQTRARNRLSSTSGCNDALFDYRMCQLQPCTCVMTREFYTTATGDNVPADDIVGFLKGGKKSVHIGDRIDTDTVVYTHNCSQFICSTIGLYVQRTINCDKKCVYLSWSPWSHCRGLCGKNGVQSRQRQPLHILSGSRLCSPLYETRSCEAPPCFGACLVSPWSKWTSCSKSCDLGVQNRTRHYLSVQPNCTDKLVESRDCNPQCCPSHEKPTWNEWGPWGECSRKCDGGERVRYRTCKTGNQRCKHQAMCHGPNKQIQPCHTETCLVSEKLECTNGKVMNNCSNACGYTCTTLPCRSCNEPSECVPGCVCPAPLVMNSLGECVDKNQCLCQTSDGKTNLISGQFITDTDKCEDCSCLDGCLDCRPSSTGCPTCPWSDWTPFGICSAECNGTQTRYRSRSCLDLSNEIEHENRSCSTNETLYKKGCAQCHCDAKTGQEICQEQCAITPEICSKLNNDPFVTYEYLPPIDGQCCGSCNRTNKTEPCSVQELPQEQISNGNCQSVNPVARQQCLGTCISGRLCRCCSPSKISIEQISMQCQRIEQNTTVIFLQQMSYAKIDSCSCQECIDSF